MGHGQTVCCAVRYGMSGFFFASFVLKIKKIINKRKILNKVCFALIVYELSSKKVTNSAAVTMQPLLFHFQANLFFISFCVSRSCEWDTKEMQFIKTCFCARVSFFSVTTTNKLRKKCKMLKFSYIVKKFA